MKEKMIELITLEFKKMDWTFDDVSNYGIARSSGGVYTITLWKNIKGEKGIIRSFKIKIDNQLEHMFLAVRTLEEMMNAHHESNDFTKRITPEVTGFGS